MSEYEEKKLFIEKIAQACDLLYDLSMEGSRITGRAKNNDDLIKVTNLLRDAEKIEEELSFSSNGLIIRPLAKVVIASSSDLPVQRLS
ncbi:hypothetical protein [Acinetobacter baumannii]|uniref:hypothetical protein n=1 Tax=Acinetobacter baumannii TaxID=470 RepID=UPI0026E92EFE|nr:hypothetical protein [Acinetobacter baumannii]